MRRTARDHVVTMPPALRPALSSILILAAVSLVAWILLRMPALGRADDHTLVLAGWLLAMALYTLAFVVTPGNPPATPRAGAKVLLVLSAILIVAAALRFHRLGDIPFVLQGDEGAFAMWGKDLVSEPLANPFGIGWLSQPNLGMMIEGATLGLVGWPIAGARLVWAILGTATVATTYLLAAKLGGRRFGLIAAALVATYHFHIHYSRVGLNNIADPLFMSLSLWCLIDAIERRSNLAWVGVGLSCGAALYFYQGARLTVLVTTAVLIGAALLLDRGTRREILRGSLMAAGAFIVSAGPMIQTALRFPDEFNARVNQISVLAPGWFAAEMAASGRSALQMVRDQVSSAALAFNRLPDTSEHYHLTTPLLDPLFGVLFVAGLAYASVRIVFVRRDWRWATVVFWWWGGMLIGGAMTISPPASQRLVTLSVPVCIFIALVLDLGAGWLARRTKPGIADGVLAGAVALFCVVSLKTYFVDFTPRHRSGGPVAELFMELIPSMKGPQAPGRVLFLGAPRAYWGMPTRAYLAPDIDGQDIMEPLKVPPAPEVLGSSRSVLFVVLPNRQDDMAVLRAAYPDAVPSEIRSHDDGALLATVLRVDR